MTMSWRTPPSSCPTDETWLRLLDESIEEETLPSLRAHLDECPSCQSRLDGLSDPLTVRGFPPPEVTPQEPISERLLAKLNQIGTVERNGGRSVPRSEFETGALLETYRIESTLGHGGMGVVYRAWDMRLNREVALKCLRPERSEPQDRADFEREARSAALLRHDHIVPVYAVGHLPDGGVFLVMPLIEGPTLRRVIQESGPLPPRQAAETVRQIADALASIHGAGVIHRDVKSGNILLDRRDGRAKLADFGLSRLTQGETLTTRQGVTLSGTPEYLCPELIRRGKADRETDVDVYALGITLYECLTGAVPFRGQPHRVLHQILNDDPRRPRDWNDAIPLELESICLKAMAYEPSARYPDATAVRDDLARWLRGEPIHARPATAWQRGLKWTRRHPWQTATVVATTCVLLGSLTATVLLQRAYAATIRANQGLRAAQEQSDQAFGLSQSALHRLVDRVTDRLFAIPNTTPLLLETYENSVGLHEQLVGLRPRDVESVVGYGKAMSQLCGLQMLNGEIPGAEQTYARYLEFAEAQQERFPADPRIGLMLVDALRCRETLSNKQGQTDRARDAVARCRTLVERLESEYPDDPRVRESRVVTLMSEITDLRRDRKYEDAIAVGRKAIESLERWRSLAPGNPEPLQTLGFLWVLHARSLEALGRLDEAAEAAAQAERLRQSPLLESVSRRDRDWDLVQLRKIQASIEAARGASNAPALHDQLADLLREQIRLFPEEEAFHEDLSLTRIELARLVARSDANRARVALDEARQVLDRLIAASPQVARYRTHREKLDKQLAEIPPR